VTKVVLTGLLHFYLVTFTWTVVHSPAPLRNFVISVLLIKSTDLHTYLLAITVHKHKQQFIG